MKKLFKNSIFFLAFFIITYSIVVFVVGKYAPVNFIESVVFKKGRFGFLFSRTDEIDKYKNIDILVIGTSHVYRGFDTRIFEKNGIKTFVLGSSAQSSIQTNLLLNRYLDEVNPKLVVYDVNPWIFNSDGIESGLDLLSNDYISFDSFQMAIRINSVKLYNTLIIGTIDEMFNLNKNFKEVKEKSGEKYISGGYVEKQLAFNNKKIDYNSNSFKFNDLQLEYFDKNIKLLEQKKIPFILIHMPINKARYHCMKNYSSIDSLMNKKSNSRYYDFNKYIKLSDTLDFYDDNHLNSNGVKKFDEFFIQFIKKEKIYPN